MQVTKEQFIAWQDRNDLSNSAAAKLLDVTSQTVSNWRNGHHAPPKGLALRMRNAAEALAGPAQLAKVEKLAARHRALRSKLKPGQTIRIRYSKEGIRLDAAGCNALPPGATYWDIEGGTANEKKRGRDGFSDSYTGLEVTLAEAGIEQPRE